MAELVKVEFVDFAPVRIIGKAIVSGGCTEKSNPIPTHWSKCFEDGTFKMLEGMSEDVASNDYIGWMGEGNEQTKEFVYITGMFMKPNTLVPDGFVYRDMPACKMAIGWVKGVEPEIYMKGMDLMLKAIKENGYEYDNMANCAVEVYTCGRYATPKSKGEKEVILDYYVPCRIKGE